MTISDERLNKLLEIAENGDDNRFGLYRDMESEPFMSYMELAAITKDAIAYRKHERQSRIAIVDSWSPGWLHLRCVSKFKPETVVRIILDDAIPSPSATEPQSRPAPQHR